MAKIKSKPKPRCTDCNHNHYKDYSGCSQCNCGESERIQSNYGARLGMYREADYSERINDIYNSSAIVRGERHYHIRDK